MLEKFLRIGCDEDDFIGVDFVISVWRAQTMTVVFLEK